jgi:outer membrane protein assembly factor BamB
VSVNKPIRSCIILSCVILFCACGAKLPGQENASSGQDRNARVNRNDATDKKLPDWPKWRGPDNDGISKETDFDPDAIKDINNLIVNDHPRVTWKQKIGRGYSGISIAGNYLYTMGYFRGKSANFGLDVVYCLEADTGREVWTLTYSCSLSEYAGPRATPLVENGKVYTLSQGGHLFCLDAENGGVYWYVDLKAKFGYVDRQMPNEFGYCLPPVIYKDILIINAHESGIALNKNTGETIWTSPNAQAGYATPVVFPYKNKYYAAIFGGAKLSIVEVETGTVFASYDWPTPYQSNIADPVIVGDTIWISASYNMGYARLKLEGNTLKPIYEVKGKGQIGHQMGPGILMNGYYYAHDNWYYYNRPEYRCFNFNTGEITWRLGRVQGSVTAIGDKLLFLDEDSRLAVVSPNPVKYTEIASCYLGRKTMGQWLSPPIYVRSHLFIRDYEGDIFSIDLSKKK